MLKRLTILFICCFSWTGLQGQITYLDRPELLYQVDSCLAHTYNFSFTRARYYQKELEKRSPEHPAPYFLNALIIYWENFPLPSKGASAEKFIELMDRSIELSAKYLDQEKTYLEGVFFDLFGRAFKAMFWADNGKAARVVPDLRAMYRHTMEGFKLKDHLNEFYFSTGLYNYYIEAYPEAHPVYKPLVSFMKPGNKELGLEQLNKAIEHTVYLKVESMLFMSIIQLKYENNLNTASIYAEKLHQGYPRNVYYQGLLVMIMLHQHRYQQVMKVLASMHHQKDNYSEMIRLMASAYIAEEQMGNLSLAGKGYRRTIELADSFGPIADTFKAIGYMGLSRLHKKKGLSSEARRYARKASDHTVYDFILSADN